MREVHLFSLLPFSLPESAGNWRGNCGGDLARHGSAAQAVDSVCPGAALGLMGLVVRDRGAVEEETTFSHVSNPAYSLDILAVVAVVFHYGGTVQELWGGVGESGGESDSMSEVLFSVGGAQEARAGG